MQIPPRPPYPNFTLSVVQQQLQQALGSCEINVYEQYYKEQKMDLPLFVRCSLDKLNYYGWLGFCSNCGMDHEAKYYRIGKSQTYIKTGRNLELRALDVSRFSQGLLDYLLDQYQAVMTKLDPQKTTFGSFSNQFPVMAKPNDLCFTELLSSKQEVSALRLISKGLQAKLAELFNANCGETLFKKQFLALSSSNRSIKCLCPSAKMENWLGYCEACKQLGHPLYLTSQNQNQQLCSENKFKIVNFAFLTQNVRFEFKQMIQKFILYRLQSTNLEVWSQFDQIKHKKDKANQAMNDQFARLEALKTDKDRKQKQAQRPEPDTQRSKDNSMAQRVLRPSLKIDTFYDVVISCDSILSLTSGNGWEIYINNQNYEDKKKQNTIIVSFYGLYNKGKTFVCSQLSQKQLPRGYSVNTVGLSALYPQDFHKENSIVFLDSAGTETPISYQKEDEIIQKHLKQIIQDNNLQEMKFHERKRRVYELKLKDRLLKEFILQKYILTMSNVVMIVVDQLTKEEQRLIQKIKNLYEQNDIIIIHNFSKLVKMEDVQKYGGWRAIAEVHPAGHPGQLRGHGAAPHLPGGGAGGQVLRGEALHHVGAEAPGHHARDHGPPRLRSRQGVQPLLLPLPHQPHQGHHPGQALRHRRAAHRNAQNHHPRNRRRHARRDQRHPDQAGEQLHHLQPQHHQPQVHLLRPPRRPQGLQGRTRPQVLHGHEQRAPHPRSRALRRLPGSRARPETVQEESHRVLRGAVDHLRVARKNQTDKIQYIMLRGIKQEDTPNEENKLHYSDREKGDFRLVIPINPNQCVLRDNLPKANLKHGVIQFIYELQQNTEYVDLF